MQDPMVSVVIPAYNAAEFIEETLDSVASQDFEGGFEAICIDDGSTDGTGEILARRAAADARFTVLSQENAGRSAARNAGIDAARGNYLLFLDSDDMLVPDAIATLVRTCEDEGLDIVYFDASSFSSKGTAPGPELQKHLDSYVALYARRHDYPTCSGKEMMAAMRANGEYLPSPCFQMARLSHIRDNSLRFIDGIIHEDNAYTFEAMIAARRVGYVPRKLYLRRVHEGSTMTRHRNFANVYGYFRCYLAMQQTVMENEELLRDCPEAEDIAFSCLESARRICAKLQREGGAESACLASKGESMRPESLSPLESSLFDCLVVKPVRDETQLRETRKKLGGIQRSKTYRLYAKLRKTLRLKKS